MICTACGVNKGVTSFRLKKRNGVMRRNAQCFECERVKFRETKHKIALREKMYGDLGSAAGEFWYVPLRPWPWPPGTKVFEDVQVRT